MKKKMNDSDNVLDQLLETEDILVTQIEKENYTLEPLLEEISLIEESSIRSFVRSILLKADVFWEIPSSFSELDNPPDEHDIGGTVLHTKRVFRICTILCESYYMFTPIDKDLILAAALLHSITKGVLLNSTPMFDEFHPYTVDKFVTSVRKQDEINAVENESSVLYIQENHMLRILRLIRCQKGAWSPIPETFPVDDMEMVLHVADHIATKLHNIIDGDDPIAERWSFIAH